MEVINYRKLPNGKVVSKIYRTMAAAAEAVGVHPNTIHKAVETGRNSPRGQESTWDVLLTVDNLEESK